MLEMLFSTFAGTILESFFKSLFGAFRLKRLDREHDETLVGKERAEQRAANAEAQSKIDKDMLNAQVSAPTDADALAERLRREAAAEAGAAP